MVNMSVRRFLLFLYFLGYGISVFAQPAVQADSLLLALEKLPERERVVQANAQFYKLFSADFAKATALGEKVLAICRKARWKDQEALTLKNLGVVNYLQGNYEQALEYSQTALSVYEQLGDAAGQGAVYNELANFSKKRKEFDRVFEYLDRAYKLCKAAGDSLCLSTSMDNRGLALLEQGQFAAADSLFRQVLLLREALRDSVGLTYVYNNLAEVAIGQGNVEASLNYLGNSTEIRRRLGDRQGVAININNMGEVLLMTGSPENAIPFFEQSLKESRALNFNDLARHTMEMLAKAHKSTGNHELAFDWLSQSYALKDSLFDVKRSAQIAEMQEKYDSEKREKELVREQARVRQRTILLVFSGGSLGLLSVIFALAMRQSRQRREQLLLESELREKLLLQESENELQQERLRISRDLHDHLGAELTLIRSALSRRAFLSEKPEEKTELNAIGDNARRAMEELRETVWAIGGEANTVENIALHLRDFASRFETAEIEVQWHPEAGALKLNSTQTLHLYRIAREAVNNALKYAPGSKVLVEFYAAAGVLMLEISDNGPGFGPPPHRQGYGLRNMRQRAEEIGGKCAIKSTEKGVSVSIALPV